MSSFTHFFGNVGRGLSSAARTLAPAIAPIAGTAIGGMFGGPAGALMGGQFGGMLGGLAGSSRSPSPSPAAAPAPSPSSFGQQAGGYANSMLPPQYQGMTMGQLGGAASNYAGNYANSMLPSSMQGLGLGNQLSGFLNNQISSRMPSGYAGQTLSGAGGMAAGQMGKRYGFADGGSVESQPGYNYGGYVPQAPFRSMSDMAEMYGHHYDHGGSVYDDGGPVHEPESMGGYGNGIYNGSY